jgi:hypothetical protein
VGSPAVVQNDRNVNPSFIHAGNEFISGSQLGFFLGIQDGETGVAINVLTSIFLYLGRKYVGVKVNNHRRIIAEALE